MRVLHVYRTYFPETQGGLQEAIRQICIGSNALGVENRVFTLTDESPGVVQQGEALVVREKKHIEIASCSIGFFAFSSFKQAADWADVIHYHLPWPFADMLHLVARVSKPCIATYHSDIVRQQAVMRFYGPILHWFLRKMSRIVATSPNYRESSRILEKHSDKVDVIPLGLDLNSYPIATTEIKHAFTERFGERFFLFIGVLRYYKGLHILLEALRDDSFTVVIAGDGPEAEALQKQAKSLGLSNVHFLGYIDDDSKVALLELAACVVFPSHLRSEAFGVTLLEGAMFACALLSTEVGTGTSYVNDHGQTGLVVEPDDVIALREAMRLLHDNIEQTAEFGRNAQLRFNAMFTGSVMGSTYADIYRDVVGG